MHGCGEQEVRAHVGYKAPEEIITLKRMPLTATGKTDRVTLKQWAAEGKLSSAGSA